MFSKYIRPLLVLLYLLVFAIPSTNAQTAPSEALTPPYPGAPFCPTHNDVTWHGLWDDVRGCHYDHTHNDDPAIGDSVFGPAGALWNGQNISYPWMTANENSEKGHSGYKYYTNLNPQPACANEGYAYLGSVNCVSAFRVEYHDAGGSAHLVKRFHSYYLEAQIQKGSVIGTIQTGGWADFGCMHGTYKVNFLPLPGIDPTQANGQTMCGPGGQDISQDPYRAPNVSYSDLVNGRFDDNPITWTSHDRYGYNRFGYFFFRTLDSSGMTNPSDPYADNFVCSNSDCKYNNSEHHIFNVFIMIPSSLDTDGDGIVNYTGYTDNKGNIVQGCTTPGANCVPLRITNAPVGTAIWSRNLSGLRPSGDPIRDHDIYFNGQPSGWIKLQSGALPYPSPAPTSIPPSSGSFAAVEVNSTTLNIGGTAMVNVKLDNVPVEGYKSAEFTCTYNMGVIEKSDIVAANLFGTDAAVAIQDPQNGTFIVAFAGTNSNKATTSGSVFTFSVKGIQAGQSQIQCMARVSKGDNVAIDLPSTGASLTILGVEPTSTPFVPPTSTPGDHQSPTATSTPPGSATPIPSTNGSLTGHIIASKSVTVGLVDANNVLNTSATTGPDGAFSLTAPTGNYTFVAMASGFLSHQGPATITAGNATVKPSISLLAGDIDGNNVIDQFDALTIGMSYNMSSPNAADLNNDGIINFLDLELLAENYRTTGPTVWE